MSNKTAERFQWIQTLNRLLLKEMPQYQEQADSFPPELEAQRRLLRSLMNLRPPEPIGTEFLTLQDQLLSAEREDKGVVDVASLPVFHDRMALWQGDITRLNADAIVNAANSALLGCFFPCHGCIDNAIHSAAGLQLREECHQLMRGQKEPTGQAKITGAYNLPSHTILHTVGPIVSGELTAKDCDLLASCYRACLELADKKGLYSVAFCCISTGEFHFPREQAAQVAIQTVRDALPSCAHIQKVIFNVFQDQDRQIYEQYL